MRRRALGILIIEDHRAVRELLRRDLEARGRQVTATNNGVEGLQAIVLGRFDAVVSDVVMLPRGGLWLWREATTLRPELRGRLSSGAPTERRAPPTARPAPNAFSLSLLTRTPCGPRSSR
jgi:CheY-like chemotaxis protein